MKTIVAIMTAVAIALLGGIALGAPDELPRTDVQTPVMFGSDLLAKGQLSLNGPHTSEANMGIHYLFSSNGTMIVTDKIFGGDWPVNVFAKVIFTSFPEVQTLVLQADGLTFER